MSTLASTYWSDISGHFITCPTICHYNPDLLTVHDIFSDNKVLSYLILSLFHASMVWTSINLISHIRGEFKVMVGKNIYVIEV